jgi:hypothetical protein
MSVSSLHARSGKVADFSTRTCARDVRIFPHAEQTAGAIPLLPDVMIDPMRGARKMDSRCAATKDLSQRNHGVI